jgi:hypothetical protein
MTSYVVSAPRSGMNWLRYCVEALYGVRTPGKTVLISEEDCPEPAFLRSHDALSLTRSRHTEGAWLYIDPAKTEGDRIAVILRDPLETYVRMAKKRLRRFRRFTGNIQFYTRAVAEHKRVFYYDDLVSSPEAMADLMTFLDIQPAPGRSAPTVDDIRARWDELGRESRASYDKRQSRGGGAQTKADPLNFRYHQKGLSDWHKARAWRFLKRTLTEEEFALLERYDPPARIGRGGPLSWLTDLV